MSIFVKNIKTFETNILGKPINLKANLAVWIHLEADYGIKQGQWQEKYAEEPFISNAKFLASILKANGYITTVNEILENVTESELEIFSLEYQKAVYGDITEILLTMLGITSDSELGKNILNTQVSELLEEKKTVQLVSKKKKHKKK
ncbi:hypothetical protein [Gemella massiliensis]|uniref:hypothetical protein n=1 Tax=Gemella massiliensis TaxID=1909670 RepID=UPI000930FBDF|nr:hypothetical protein [Gemella massiliensis]